MSTKLSDYSYDLPEELIADRPSARRDESRLMLVERSTGRISHHIFHEIPDLIPPGALAVLNNTKVIPARLFDKRQGIEVLLLSQSSENTWLAMVKPGKKMRPGCKAELGGTIAHVVEICEDGTRKLRFDAPPDLQRHGVMPLPPYIRRQSDPSDLERYQTVYAQVEGAVAAPTAGLHFTQEILARIPHTAVTLHVGAGTFKPVQNEDITKHVMHTEQFCITPEAASAINAAHSILAVGTTVVRVLESVVDNSGHIPATESSTNIFIHPPFTFRATDHLLTNFHLSRSTLLMLVAAFAGRELILQAYREAVAARYRFFSYGDCMLIL